MTDAERDQARWNLRHSWWWRRVLEADGMIHLVMNSADVDGKDAYGWACEMYMDMMQTMRPGPPSFTTEPITCIACLSWEPGND